MNEKKLSPYTMIYEAVESLSSVDSDLPITYAQITDRINEHYEKQTKSNVARYVISMTVNAPSRINYGNRKPRLITEASPRDFLFSVDSESVVKYDPHKHGIWEIRKSGKSGQVIVSKVETKIQKTENPSSAFALESHLRDYLAKNLGTLKIHDKKLELIRTEYSTGVGYVDILAKDDEDNFYIFELKCSKGTDKALGQILRYMGWFIAEEAKDRKVFGIIVAEKIDPKLKYATRASSNIDLFEYEVNFQLKPLD